MKCLSFGSFAPHYAVLALPWARRAKACATQICMYCWVAESLAVLLPHLWDDSAHFILFRSLTFSILSSLFLSCSSPFTLFRVIFGNFLMLSLSLSLSLSVFHALPYPLFMYCPFLTVQAHSTHSYLFVLLISLFPTLALSRSLLFPLLVSHQISLILTCTTHVLALFLTYSHF